MLNLKVYNEKSVCSVTCEQKVLFTDTSFIIVWYILVEESGVDSRNNVTIKTDQICLSIPLEQIIFTNYCVINKLLRYIS